MKLVEENNKQKFELLKPNDDLKNDIQTIKQLLLTRQASSALVSESKDKEELDEDFSASGAGVIIGAGVGANLAASAPPPILTSTGSGLKPWEQRRRARIETTSTTPPSTPAQVSNVATPVLPGTPTTSSATPVAGTTPIVQQSSPGLEEE